MIADGVIEQSHAPANHTGARSSRGLRSAARLSSACAPNVRACGAIAQLGERLDRTQEVAGSSPASSIEVPEKRTSRRTRLATAAIAVQLVLAGLAPAARAEAPAVLDPHGVSVAAYRGWAAWSRPDPATGQYALVARSPQGSISLPAVAESSSPFDVELGPAGGSGVAAVYSRCADTATLKGCHIVSLDLAAPEQPSRRSLRPVAGQTTSRRSRKGGLAFLRRNPSGGSRRPDSLLAWRIGSRKVQTLALPRSRGASDTPAGRGPERLASPA